MTVLTSKTALYVALKLLPEGTRLTVHVREAGTTRAGVVAVLRKEPDGGWNDWQVLSRPTSSDASLLPPTWPAEDPEVISSRDLAGILGSEPDLWADVHD